MGKIRALAMLVLVVVATSLTVEPVSAGTPWNSLRAGNPVLPGYFADPCCRKFGDTYYLYVTPDGWDVGKGPYAIWTSKDFVNWTAHKSPGINPGTFWPATDFKWAPSVVEYKGKYYMYSQTPCMVWGAVADTPLGPWKSLAEDGKPVIPDGTPKGSIVLDGECFIDTDNQVYIWYSTWWTPTMVKMNSDMCTFASDPIQYFKRDNNQTPKGTIQGCMEAPYMFKHNGTYYLMYSDFFCNNSTYCVEYSTSKSPDGPFTYGKNNPILSTNADDTVDGPGHHTILEDNGKVYIVYHRHDNPHAADGAHRQTAIDELHFNADGSIEKVVPTHSGVGYLAPSTKRDTNIALGKTATASSFAGPDFKPAYAADENNGTLWKASEYKYPQWFQVDLGKSEKVARVETEFQFAQIAYSYVLECSNDGKTWQTFADRRENKDWGPMIDKGSVTARYFKMTLLGDDSPSRPAPEIAIWNVKIYDGIDKPNQAPKVDAGPDVKGTINFPTRILDAVVTDDGLPNGPVSLKWTKISGPGTVTFEHPDRAYTNVTFGGAGKYVLQLEANDGKLIAKDTVTFDILPPGDELIYYKFDEDGGTVADDSSINGQFGVANVGIARCLGMHGGALNMSGNDYVTVPSLGEQSALTIAAWVNPHTLNSDQNSIVCSSGENGLLQATIARSGEICLSINGKKIASSDFKFSPESLGWWKPIAIAYDSAAKNVSFFVDGKLDCTRTLAEAPKLDLSAGLKIGGGTTGVRGLDGEIDDFRLYAKAMPAAAIAEISVPAKFPTIADAKKLSDGTPITLMGKVVTYAPMDPMTFERTTQSFYIAERDGSNGIMVQDGNAGQDKVKPDTCVSLTGVVKHAVGGKAWIELTAAPSLGAPYTAKTSDSLGSDCLVKIKGDVVSVSEDGKKFAINDGKTKIDAIVDKGVSVKKIAVGNTIELIGLSRNKLDGDLLVKDLTRLNPPPAPILAHYAFDETSGTVAKDSSGNGYDATLVNDPTWVKGEIGGAVCLDGKKSYVQLPDLGLQPELTIALWANETSLGSDAWSTALVHADSWNIGDLHLQIPCKQGNIGAAINGAGDVNSNFVFVGNTGKWVHVVFTYSAKARNMAIYVNGKLERSGGMGEARPINLTHSKLGSWGGSSRFFDGKFDDLRIYDRVLSAEEIAKLYNSGD